MDTPLQVGKIIQLNIDSLSYGSGAGVGRVDGMVVFVPFSAPGDFLEARLTNVKKNFAEAELIAVLTPSKFRTEPPCPYFKNCGGCDWQHVAYERQTLEKQNNLHRLFKKLLFTKGTLHPIVASPQPNFYRNRIQLHKKGLQYGFLKKGTHELIQIDSCRIADPDINVAIKKWRLSLFQVKDGKYEFLKTPRGEVIIQTVADHKNELGFSQIDSSVNQLLIDAVVDLVPSDSLTVWDLFAGNGNFSFPFAKKCPAAQVYSVEMNARAHESAQSAARQMNVSNVTPIQKSVEAFLRSYRGQNPDFVLLDPPRAGLTSATLSALGKVRPPTLTVYVSCDPMTLQRDLNHIFKHWPVELTDLYCFDMFPQTSHVETLAVLKHTTPI